MIDASCGLTPPSCNTISAIIQIKLSKAATPNAPAFERVRHAPPTNSTPVANALGMVKTSKDQAAAAHGTGPIASTGSAPNVTNMGAINSPTQIEEPRKTATIKAPKNRATNSHGKEIGLAKMTS